MEIKENKRLVLDRMINEFFQDNEVMDEVTRQKFMIYSVFLVEDLVNKRFPLATKDEKEELISIGKLELIKAIDTYNYRYGTIFSQYAITCINHKLSKIIRSMKSRKILEELEEVNGKNNILQSDVVDPIAFVEKKEQYEKLKKAFLVLKEREKEMIMLFFGFYGQKFTVFKIGQMYHLTPQRVSAILHKGLEKLKNELIDILSLDKKKFTYQDILSQNLSFTSLISPIEKEMFSLYILGLSELEIAKNLQVSSQWVSKCVLKILEICRENMDDIEQKKLQGQLSKRKYYRVKF